MKKINNDIEFIEQMNKLLEKYEITVNLGEGPAGVLAWYNTQDRQIYINKNDNRVFNDYITLITVLFHENAHAVNHDFGKTDVEFDSYGNQVHTDVFKNSMTELYGLYCDSNYNGNVSYLDERNLEVFDELVRNKLKDRKDFHDLSDYFLKEHHPEEYARRAGESGEPEEQEQEQEQENENSDNEEQEQETPDDNNENPSGAGDDDKPDEEDSEGINPERKGMYNVEEADGVELL